MAGELTGSHAETLSIHLDDLPITPTVEVNTGRLFLDWEQELAPGLHRLQLSLPDIETTGTVTCRELCLHNLQVKLAQPQHAADALPIATFVTETDDRLALLATTIVDLPPTAALAPTSQLLVNSWRLDDRHHTILHDAPTQMPVNYIHLTDAAGNTLLQADHQLGQRRLYLPDERILVDLVALPVRASASTPTELRMGLWYPQTEQYFWSPDVAKTDAVGRVNIGQLVDMTNTHFVPPLPINKRFSTRFTNSADGRSLHLLDAYITTDSNEIGQYQLATVWAQPDLFIAPVSVTLFAHLLDREGELLESVEHVLTHASTDLAQ